jgi:hypothetical protein
LPRPPVGFFRQYFCVVHICDFSKRFFTRRRHGAADFCAAFARRCAHICNRTFAGNARRAGQPLAGSGSLCFVHKPGLRGTQTFHVSAQRHKSVRFNPFVNQHFPCKPLITRR